MGEPYHFHMPFPRLFSSAPSKPARFLEGRVGYAIGDIHGRSDLLSDLLAKLEAGAVSDQRPAGPPIAVFLGDYVDRGPDSAGVIEMLLRGRPAGFERRFLRGNHEQAMLAFLDDPVANKTWMRLGGAETLLSYGVQPPALAAPVEQDLIGAAQLLRARMSDAHHRFLLDLERYVELGDYAFVHAGVDASKPLDQQTDDTLYWTRKTFLADRRQFSHRVVHGHTPVDEPFADARRIAVDTGAYATGRLTAVRLEGESDAFLSVTRRSFAPPPV
ncbi:MAG: serine/threonine protein phosphatase [Hyphomonadaceae bacterium]|nr:serine/threonine protein phosphatase [Hyphomonadaceae bacterium]